jgi:hypothetical protein
MDKHCRCYLLVHLDIDVSALFYHLEYSCIAIFLQYPNLVYHYTKNLRTVHYEYIYLVVPTCYNRSINYQLISIESYYVYIKKNGLFPKPLILEIFEYKLFLFKIKQFIPLQIHYVFSFLYLI